MADGTEPMNDTAPFVLTGSVALLIGIVIGGLLTWKTRTNVLGASALGLLVGVIIGLSASPVVATAVTAGFGLATHLVNTFLTTRKAPPAEGVCTNSEARQLFHLLGPFALLTVAGLLLGVTIRVNDYLYFRDADLKEYYTAKGFNEAQVEEIMDRLAANVSSEPPPGGTVVSLLSNTERIKWESVWSNAQAFDTDEEKLEHIADYTQAIPAVGVRIQTLQKQKKSIAEILNSLEKEFGGEP